MLPPERDVELARAHRARPGHPDELILNEGDFDEAAVLEIVETAHRAGVKVRIAPKTTDLLLQRGEYVPGQGDAALRAAAAGARRRRTGR